MPYYNRDPKRDHHFDNHPAVDKSIDVEMSKDSQGHYLGFRVQDLGFRV